METYEESTNVLSYGGQLQSALKTVPDCQNACHASSMCAGFDFTNSNECWLHTDITIAKQGSGMGVSQYKKNACDTSPHCVVTFEETTNVFSYNGQLQSTIKTVRDCQNACSASSTCAGLDFTHSNLCWLHTQSSIVKQGSGMGVSQYKKNACDIGSTTPVCRETYEETANVFSFGGKLQSALTLKSECQNACSISSTCGGYDFTSSNECWLHTHSTLNNQESGPGVTQYKKNACSAGLTTPTGDVGFNLIEMAFIIIKWYHLNL